MDTSRLVYGPNRLLFLEFHRRNSFRHMLCREVLVLRLYIRLTERYRVDANLSLSGRIGHPGYSAMLGKLIGALHFRIDRYPNDIVWIPAPPILLGESGILSNLPRARPFYRRIGQISHIGSFGHLHYPAVRPNGNSPPIVSHGLQIERTMDSADVRSLSK